MNVAAYEDIVIPEYKKRHPDVSGARISEVVRESFGGDLVVIRSDEQVPHEEIVFVGLDHSVRVFSTTEELVYFLENQSNRSVFDRLFSRPIFSAIIFFSLLVVLAIAGFTGSWSDPVALTILGNVVSLAAGFFFGTKQNAQS